MNFYITLGLRPGASVGEIRRAYRRLARRFHPGINPGDQAAAEMFRQIVAAYEVLNDPERRRQYDAGEAPGGSAPVAPPGAPTFEFQGFDFSVVAEGRSASTFGDLFADVIRAAVPGAAPARGADLHGDLQITFDQAMTGTTGRLTVTRLHRCLVCDGRGLVETMEAAPCPHCGGVGALHGARGHMRFTKSCGHCAGTGRLRVLGCQACRGEGVMMHTEALAIDVPAGVHDGETVRLPQRGSAGRLAAPPGDLYVTVHVAAHRFFRRDGNDLHVDVPVALHEAMLGARIDVPSPSGACKVKIPPGTQSGHQVRLHERGVPSLRGGPPGDLVVTIRLVLPALQDERSKALVRELADLNPQNVRQDLGV